MAEEEDDPGQKKEEDTGPKIKMGKIGKGKKGKKRGAAGGDAGGCGGMAVTQIGPILLAHCTFSPLGYLVPLGY